MDMQLDSLRDLLTEELQDLRSAETQLVEALPNVAAAAHAEELRRALNEHLTETRSHVERLDDLLAELGASGSTHCKGMEGLIAEGKEIVGMSGDPMVKDAALIGAAQRIEHYEIAAYGTARTLASEIGLDSVSEALDQTLDEEANADKLLTKIATGGLFSSGVNKRAAG